MKNHKTKNFLIIGTVFCALGTVLFASGIAAGGREYIKNTDLNTYNGSFSSAKSDGSHAILEKKKNRFFPEFKRQPETYGFRSPGIRG